MKALALLSKTLVLIVASIPALAQTPREKDVFVLSDANQCIRLDKSVNSLCLTMSRKTKEASIFQLVLDESPLLDFSVGEDKLEIALSPREKVLVVKRVNDESTVLSVYSFDRRVQDVPKLTKLTEINEPSYNHIERIDDNGDIVFALAPGDHEGCNRYEVEKRKGRISHTERCVKGINAFTEAPLDLPLPHLCFQFEH